MKLTSTNIEIIANKEMGLISIKQRGRQAVLIDYQHYDELLELLYDAGHVEPDTCSCLTNNII